MKILVFLAALAVAYAVQDPIKYEVGKKYVYEYEGFTLSGVPRSTSMNSGLKVSAKLDISVVDEGRMLLKVRVPEIATFNGTWPTTQFKKSEQLTTKLAPDIEKPIIFEYQNGVVGQIFAPSDLPEPVLNIHRGIINMLHVNLKSTENYFKAQELGIGGICETAYAIVDLEDMVQVVKTKHYDTCIERPVTILNHIRVPYVLTEQQTPNHRAAAVFRYNMTEYGKGLIIQEAMGEEEHVFTLFSEQGGSVETTIRQQLRFVNKASADTIPSIDMANRGDVMFKTPESIVPAKQLTVTKQEITTVLNTIVDNMSFDDISIESPGHWITLLQYLRQAEKQMIMEIWNELSVKLAYRKFLIDTLPIVGTLESIEAIHDIIKANPSIVRENTACLLTGLAFIPRPTLEMINRVEMMIEDPIIAEFTPARRIAMLSFGSLIHNFCHNKTSCPASLIEVLINKYESAPNTTEKEVVLKAMGNAGTVDLVPWIRKLFKKPEQLNVRIQSVAIEALRKIAPMYPTQVRTLLLPILLNPKFDPEVRIISCVILFETKPSVPTVIVIAQQLKIETSNQVASFIFSHINSLANSTAPEKLPTARACKIALRFAKLRPELTARFSKGLHLSMFSQTMNMGGSVDFHIIKHPASFMPRHVHTKVNMNIGGYVVNVLEIGIRAEGIQRLIENMTEPQSMFKKHKNMMDMIKKSRRPPISSEEFETRDEVEHLINRLYKYKPTKEQETELLGHLYVRLFGNELYLFELDKTVLLDIVKAGSLGLDFEKIERKLREGLSYNWLKAMPLFEISIFEPSILGLPLHLHLMSSWISTMKTSTSATMIRDPDMHVKPSSSEEESNEHYSSEEHWWQETPSRSHNSGEFEFDMHHRPKPVSRQQRYRESHYMTESLTGIKAEAQFVKNDAIHIQVRMGVDAILVQTGVGIAMKMKSNIPLIGEMNLDLAHQKYFINFDPIKTPRELMVFSSNIFTFTKSPRELYGRISIISPPMKKTVEEPRMMKKEICLEMLKEVAGFEYCADVEYPSVAGYANAPYPPMTGPYWFESRLMPATDQPKSIQFSVENIIPITMQSIKVEIDTIVKLEAIGAQRTTGVEMSVKYNAKTPTKRLDIVLEKISTEEKMVIINFVTDNIIEQGSLEMQIPVKDYDIKTSYETKMKPYPAIKFKSEINKIPDSIVAPLSMWTNFIERYVYYMGVAEVEMEANTPKTIEAIVVLKKPDVIDIEMKIPSCTIIRRGMTLPIPIDVTEISTPTDTMSSLMHKVKKVVKDQMATCKVMGTHFETFDNVTYQYQLPGDCKHVLTRDGSKLSKFLVLVHRPIDKPTEKIVTAHIEEHKVELLPSMIVKVQDRPIQWREDKYVIPDVLTLVKTPTEILLMANVGIDITYTGEDVITRVNPIFHAKTVGLCGDNNDEKTNELKQPDQTVVTNPTVFAHSWIIAGESCTDACKLTPKFDIREEILNGEDKICFSTVPVKHCIRGCEPRQTVTVSVGFHCMPADYKSADRTERLLRSGEYDMVNLSSKSIDIERHVEAHVACECDACLNLPRDNYYV